MNLEVVIDRANKLPKPAFLPASTPRDVLAHINFYHVKEKVMFTAKQIASLPEPLCWRQCGDQGTLAHILWYYKSLRSYWWQIFTLISAISGHQTITNPALALQHIGIENLPRNTKSVIIHLLLAAKLNITRLWRTPSQPTMANMVLGLNYQCDKKRLIARKILQLEWFTVIWSPWLSHPI